MMAFLTLLQSVLTSQSPRLWCSCSDLSSSIGTLCRLRLSPHTGSEVVQLRFIQRGQQAVDCVAHFGSELSGVVSRHSLGVLQVRVT